MSTLANCWQWLSTAAYTAEIGVSSNMPLYLHGSGQHLGFEFSFNILIGQLVLLFLVEPHIDGYLCQFENAINFNQVTQNVQVESDARLPPAFLLSV